MDNFFPAERISTMVRDFDVALAPSWYEYRGSLQSKRSTLAGTPLPHAVQEYFNVLYSGPFLRFLTRITGIADLIPDPALYGGGMHEIDPGGCFEVHVDFAKHPRTKLNNRLVVLTYLNEDWHAADGGALELWSFNPPQRDKILAPTLGRTVIIEQSAHALHGQPDPVQVGRVRRSAVAYFYTNGLTGNGTNDTLDTTYIPHAGYSPRQKAEYLLRSVMPPALIKGLKAVRNVLSS